MRFRTVLSLAIASLCTLAPGLAAADSTECPQFYAKRTPPQITKPAMARSTRELCFSTFGVMHSGITRTPLWSAEYLTPSQLQQANGLERIDSFHAEPSLPESERAELADYARSGYDRGHLAPNGDMPDHKAQSDSFSLANMVPQAPKVNRGQWSEIEEIVRKMVEAGQPLYVVSGPLFEGQKLAQLNKRVLVPTSVFKAVYDPKTSQAAAYVITNDKDASSADIQPEVISIAELARRSSIDVFPFLSADAKNSPMELEVPRKKRK